MTPDANGWMPIETAPIDGSLMMLACANWPISPIPVKVGGYWNGKWNVFGSSWEPTHWQPLLKPPVQP